MDFRTASNKPVLINLSIALMIPLIYWIYGDSWNNGEQILGDLWKGILILIILLLGLVAGIRELFELKYVIKGELGWFFLTFLATAGHIILYMEAMKYLGYDFTGNFSGDENTILVIGGLSFTIFFLFELLFILAHESRKDQELRRNYSWSDVFLSIYAAFGSVYIWDILLGDIGFKFENPGYFIFAELLPAILLFLMLILPFKRYDLMANHGYSRSKKEKTYLFLSYLLIIGSAIVPRILESYP